MSGCKSVPKKNKHEQDIQHSSLLQLQLKANHWELWELPGFTIITDFQLFPILAINIQKNIYIACSI